MHDKTIRRRRAVLLGLVVASLLLLTAYFGESAGGGLHSFQRGVSAVLSPIQEGASRALKPVRDGVGWVGDTFDAKGENERLKDELAQSRALEVNANAQRLENEQFRRMNDMNEQAQLQDMGLVTARVITRSPSVLNQTLKINTGSSKGVKAGQPVVTGSGLVGTVDSVGPNFATVTLLTDADFGAGAKISSNNVSGIVTPRPGAPRELRFQGPGASDDVRKGDIIVTSGKTDPELPSPFPPNVPIGKVADVKDPGSDSPTIRVTPYVNTRDLDFVQVVTKMDQGTS